MSKEEQTSDEDLIFKQYQGKETLYPICKALTKQLLTFGDDVLIVPKKTSVSIIRKRQFALIKPATKTRIDLGLKLNGKANTDRLGNSGPFGSMCTHRVRISSIEDVDQELTNWLLEAYHASV